MTARAGDSPTHLYLRVGDETARVAIDCAQAPATSRALLALVPFSTTVRFAKIAGDELMAHLPIIVDPESPGRVSDLAAGAVAFWPERQMLCVYFGLIQKEDADVTLLGSVVDNLSGLARAHAALRGRSGRRAVMTLELVSGDPRPSETSPANDPVAVLRPGPPGLEERITQAFRRMEHDAPPEVGRLLALRGVMRPAGALVYAEAESRKLHETLWLFRGELVREGRLSSLATVILRHFARRFIGWYGLEEAGRLCVQFADDLPLLAPAAALGALEALMIYAGRLNFWLDSYIPWEELNVVLQTASPDA